MTPDQARTILEAYNKGLLTAQSGEGCRYHVPSGRRCAIGWLLPEQIAIEVSTRSNASTTYARHLCDEGLLTGDRGELAHIQFLHDDWAMDPRPEAEREFVSYIRGFLS